MAPMQARLQALEIGYIIGQIDAVKLAIAVDISCPKQVLAGGRAIPARIRGRIAALEKDYPKGDIQSIGKAITIQIAGNVRTFGRQDA